MTFGSSWKIGKARSGLAQPMVWFYSARQSSRPSRLETGCRATSSMLYARATMTRFGWRPPRESRASATTPSPPDRSFPAMVSGLYLQIGKVPSGLARPRAWLATKTEQSPNTPCKMAWPITAWFRSIRTRTAACGSAQQMA